MQSQHENLLERGGRRAGDCFLDLCWVGACKVLGMEQHTVERMGEKRQSEISASYGAA